MRRALLGAVLAVLWVTVVWQRPVAWAHSVLVQASIMPGSLIADLPTTLTLRFSEDLAVSLCSLHVNGPGGADASVGVPQAGPDAQSLQLTLRAQGGGTYSVSWSTVSAEDGQVVTGGFHFAVGYVSQAGDLQARVRVHGESALGVTGLLAALTYWLLLLIAVIWAGGALFEMPLGLVGARPAVADEDRWIALLASQSHTLRGRLLDVLLGLLAFSWLVEAARLTLTGQVSLAGGIIHLFGGRLGAFRLLALAVVVLALADLRRPATARAPAGSGAGLPLRAALSSRLHAPFQHLPSAGRWGQLAFAALFLLALAAGGHASAVPMITLSAVLIAWLHCLAAAAWIGGLAYLSITALPVTQNLDLDRRAPVMIGLLRRFIPLACSGIALLAISGLFAAQIEVGSRARLIGNPYGDALSLKVLATLAAFALTVYLLSVQRSRLERIWAQRQRLECLHALGGIGRALRLGALIGAAVLAATTALWSSAPAATNALPEAAALLSPLPSTSWQTAGLFGRTVYRLQFDPQDRHTLWAATDSGVWRSTDDQQTWTLQGRSLAHLAIYDLLFLDGDRGLLAAAADGSLYRTYDAGAHWQQLAHPFGHHPLRVLAAGGRILVAGGDDGLFRSTDDSLHWHRVSPAPPAISALYWSASSGQFLAGTQGRPWQIYEAGASGASWQPLSRATASVRALLWTSDTFSRTFAGTTGDGVWAFAQPGGWQQVTTGLARGSTVDALLVDTRTLGRLYLGTVQAGIYASADGGTSWAPLGRNGPPSALSLAMRPGAVRILYAGTTGGVYKITIGV
ncbi:MAG TPA: copper resistance protein CopC [Chloroflexota bacterium]|jgi:methionine-rich copper-binding protein CopC/putative copper export protein/photosystem II stability/assembly factor-like uncharacterized protein|nr:copper resistance protein CopC [Chloroflexota bacterium]